MKHATRPKPSKKTAPSFTKRVWPSPAPDTAVSGAGRNTLGRRQTRGGHRTFTLKVGSKVLYSRIYQEGFATLGSELLTVIEIGDNFVQFKSDNNSFIRLMR